MDLSRPERAKIAVRYLAKKLNKSQQEIGQMLGYSNKAAFSAVLNGKSRYFSNSIPGRIADLDPSINIDFLEGTSDELLLPGNAVPNSPDFYDIRETSESSTPAAHQGATQIVQPGSIVIPPDLIQLFTDLTATIRSQQETILQLVNQKGESMKVG